MEASLLIINSKKFEKLMAFWSNSLSYTLKQNGIAKHKNWTLVENARFMWTHVRHSNVLGVKQWLHHVLSKIEPSFWPSIMLHHMKIWYDIKLNVSTI